MKRRGPSAAFVLGIFSGSVAAVAVLPTAIPLQERLQAAEEALALRHASNAANLALRELESEKSLPPGTLERLGLTHLHVTSADGLLLYQEGPDLPADLVETACARPHEPMATKTADGGRWALACLPSNGQRVVAGWVPNVGSTGTVIYLIFALAAIVGIVTALGVLRMLSPLSQLSRAIVRVGAGERGVRLPIDTGMNELDEMVERLNTAASAMEDREDAILGRIRVVQEMSRMVAHEVRNPLQSLELLTSLIASEDNGEEREALANAIHAEIRALDMVVTRVLREGASRGASKLPLHRAPQQLEPLIEQVLTLRRPEAKAHGIALERGTVAPLTASIDAALIGRSVENLVLNALQAVPPRNGRVRLSLNDENTHFAIVVEDNGPGVDPALSEHIFEPNVTGRTGGTGLGLALVKEVIVAHGGTIVHDRSPLGGARFTVRVPLEAPLGADSTERADRR